MCGGAGFAELVYAFGGAPINGHAAFFEVLEGGGCKVLVVFDLGVPYASVFGGDDDVFHAVCGCCVVSVCVCYGCVSAYALRAVMSMSIPAVRNASRANTAVAGGYWWLGGVFFI